MFAAHVLVALSRLLPFLCSLLSALNRTRPSVSQLQHTHAFHQIMVSSTATDATAKMYVCPVCSREFNKKANLKVHSRKHTGEKPYACSRPGCDRRFMWKSSVSFHEQNCLVGSRDDLSGIQSVPKRPKTAHRPRNDGLIPTTPTTPLESPPRSHVTNIQNPAMMPVESVSAFSVQHDFRNAEILRHAVQSASSIAQQQHYMRLANASMQSQQSLPMARQPNAVPMFSMGQHVPTATSGPKPVIGNNSRSAPVRNLPNDHPHTSSALFSHLSTPDQHDISQKPFVPPSYPTAPFNVSFQSVPASSSQPTSSLPPSFPTEANPLPAPSTILEKSIPTSGRPPVPPPLPKPIFNGKGVSTANEQGATVTKTEPSMIASAAKPPKMHGSALKMPIAMDLDESDDEGADRIIGAQENFLRTGNIFTGFAPPPRCSPLPASSPIVCPGISPMPLSPLAPFSPLPPDSPAHNAPAPVHPPLNQPQRTNF